MKRLFLLILFIGVLSFLAACTSFQSSQDDCVSVDVLSTLDAFQLTKTVFETQQVMVSECLAGQEGGAEEVESTGGSSPQASFEPSQTSPESEAQKSPEPPPAAEESAPVQSSEFTIRQDVAPLWVLSFETGNLSEFIVNDHAVGEHTFTDPVYAQFQMVTSPVKNGNYAGGLTIDTTNISEGPFYSSLVYYGDLPADSYFYSTWYYIPSGVRPVSWWMIMEWMSTEGSPENIYPMYALYVTEKNGELVLDLGWRADQPESTKAFFYQDIMTVPRDQWFHLEAYYKRAQNETGHIIVWQDGVEIFNVTGYPTVLIDNNIFFEVNSYAESVMPQPSTIYVDDMMVSEVRMGVR